MNDEAPSTTPPARSDSSARNAQKLVVGNTLFLAIGQALGMPLSLLLNAVMARYLGPAGLGYLYLGTTFTAFGFLVSDWGQSGALPALVATNHALAGRFAGTSMTWRFCAGVLACGALALLTLFLGYDPELRIIIALLSVFALVSTVVNTCQDTIVGFERTDVTAKRQVSEQFTQLLVIGSIVLLGGGLRLVATGYIVGALLMLLFVSSKLREAGVTRMSFDQKALRALLHRGTPFVFFNLAMALQPNIDAVFLSKFAPAEVIGWHAAARKLIGLLVFPASALINALYPTLCRLYATDYDAFLRTSSASIRSASLLVMPVALGCALYPDIGIAVFSRTTFHAAEGNLRVLSVFLFLMYFTMPFGSILLAGGRQNAWAIVQAMCVVVSAVLDPFLVPFFQHRMGNGGIGVCVAAVVSEVFVAVCGVWFAPRGLFDRRLVRTLGSAALAGAAMAAVAFLLRSLSSFVAAPIALAAFVVALIVTGGVEKSQFEAIREFFESKLRRVKPSA